MKATKYVVAQEVSWQGSLFAHIVCGVDGTESSRVAVAQAVRLLAARGTLQLVSVVEGSQGPWLGALATADRDRQYEEAQRTMSEARSQCPHARSLLTFGSPGPTLVSAAGEVDATLLVVGAPATGRLGGIVLGSVGTHLLHHGPCSVLIARPSKDESEFPRSILVGHDGSRGARAAAAIAKELAHRFDAALRVIVATGGEPVQIDPLVEEPELEWSSLSPVDALVEASTDTDLLVVGSRGLRGLRALGSVSERVGHLAHCSVLVAREPRGAAAADRVEDAVPDTEC